MDIRWPALGSEEVSLRAWPEVDEEETAVVGVVSRCGTVLDC